MKYKILETYTLVWAEIDINGMKLADIEVTAVELDPELARMYQERFPNIVNY